MSGVGINDPKSNLVPLDDVGSFWTATNTENELFPIASNVAWAVTCRAIN